MLEAFFDMISPFSKPFILINRYGDIYRHNKAFVELYGPIQNIFEQFQLGATRQTVYEVESFRKKLDGGEPFIHRVSYRVQKSKGYFHLEVAPQAAKYEGDVVFLMNLELRQDTESCERGLYLMNKIIEVAQDVILIAEAGHIDSETGDPRVIAVNPAFEATTGYSAEEIIGKTPRILQGKGTSRTNLDKIRNALEKWEPVQTELLNYKKDGTPFWSSLAITPIADETGWFTHWVAIQRDITHLKKVQEEMGRREFLLKETQKMSKTGGWELDISTGHTIWTEEVYHIHEVPIGFDHNKESGIEFYHPEDKPYLIEALENSIKEKINFDVTLRFYTAKNRLLRVRVTGHPILEGGKVVKLIGVIQNITNQYKIEKALKNLKDRFQLAAKAANMGVWAFNPKTNELIWDETMYELYEVKKENFSGAYDAWSSSLHPDSLESAQKELELALAGVKDFRTEFSIIRPNGDIKILAAEATIKRNDAGEAIRMIGVNYDITEKKKQLHELTLLHSVVESAGDSILITTPKLDDQQILYTNPAHEEMTGYTAEEIIGKSPRIFQGPLTSTDELRRIREALKRREVIQVEVQNYRKSGEPFWINMIITYVRNEYDEVTHFVSIQRDTTEKKLAELELVRAKNMAEEASNAKSEFLSVMSHEIRTPLNAVIGVCGLLDTTTRLDFEQKDLVKTIRQGGETLLSVINDVLDFSKIEAGKIELEEINFDLRSPVADVMDLLRNQAFAKGLELMYHLEDACDMRIKGDIGRLRQVIMNLVGNAIKFTTDGEVVVWVRHLKNEEETLHVEFEIQDSGIGIPKEKQGRLFQAFSQVDASTTREYGGTGLGLAIVKKLVKLMGGEIKVASELGKGTSFFVNLAFPIVAVPSQGEDLNKAYQSKRVLLVDDNQTSLEIIQQNLLKRGLSVDAFQHPSELLDRIAAHRDLNWDLAMVDSFMPEIDGKELIKRLRLHSHMSSLPIILMTSEEKQVGALQSLGIKGIIRKPISPDGISHYLREVFAPEDQKKPGGGTPTMSNHMADFSCFSILLVEDNLVNQKVAKKILERYNIKVEVAGNGLEGCESVHRQHFDLVFMDMQMPVLDGVEATRNIRARGEEVHQPVVVAMTANTSVQDREKCMEAGMNDFLTKPISLKSVGKILEKWSSYLFEEKGLDPTKN